MGELLFKAFVITFYKAFLGFFILLIIILGVFMELKQHLMIADRLMQNPVGFSSVLLLFILYAVAQQRFQVSLMNDRQYKIFHYLGFFSWRRLCWYFLPVWLANHAFILLYALLLTYVGLTVSAGVKLVILWLFVTAIYLTDLLLVYYKLKRSFPDYIHIRTRLFKNLTFNFWFLTHLREKRPLLILVVKLLSVFLLNGFFYLFSNGKYDIRWLEFGLLCTTYIHFPIWMEKHLFESQQMVFFHNMPLSFVLKLRTHFAIIVIFLLPELALISYKYGGTADFSGLFSLAILLISLNMGIFGLIKLKKNAVHSHKAAYLVFFVLFLLVIFGVHPILISALCLVPFLLTIRSSYSV